MLIQLLSMRAMTAAYIHWSATQLKSVRLPPDARVPKLVRTLAGFHEELADMQIGRLQYAQTTPSVPPSTTRHPNYSASSVKPSPSGAPGSAEEPFMHNASPLDD